MFYWEKICQTKKPERNAFVVTGNKAREEERRAAVNQVKEMVCGVKPRELDELAQSDTDETDAEYTNGTKDTDDMGGMDIGNGKCENEQFDLQQEFKFDDDLFGMSKTKEKKSRTQKRKEKKNRRESSVGTSEKQKVRGMSRKEIMELQESDQSLRYCWEKSKENTKSTNAMAYFYKENGHLHRHWQPKCTHEVQCEDASFRS